MFQPMVISKLIAVGMAIPSQFAGPCSSRCAVFVQFSFKAEKRDPCTVRCMLGSLCLQQTAGDLGSPTGGSEPGCGNPSELALTNTRGAACAWSLGEHQVSRSHLSPFCYVSRISERVWGGLMSIGIACSANMEPHRTAQQIKPCYFSTLRLTFLLCKSMPNRGSKQIHWVWWVLFNCQIHSW